MNTLSNIPDAVFYHHVMPSLDLPALRALSRTNSKYYNLLINNIYKLRIKKEFPEDFLWMSVMSPVNSCWFQRYTEMKFTTGASEKCLAIQKKTTKLFTKNVVLLGVSVVALAGQALYVLNNWSMNNWLANYLKENPGKTMEDAKEAYKEWVKEMVELLKHSFDD